MDEIFDYFGPQGTPVILGLLMAFGVLFIKWVITKRENLQSDEINRTVFQNEFKKAISTQESIHVADFLLDESAFWDLIDKTRKKSKDNFKNQCGLLKQYFEDSNTGDLLAFQSRLFYFILKYNSYKLQAAFSIVSYSTPFADYGAFLEWMISKGETLANNYIQNPELLENANFSGIDNSVGMSTFLGEVYNTKTGKLVPTIEGFDENALDDSEIIDPKMIPDSFPRLWKKFIV
ncbi:hypothetical protein ADIS_3799 [Lunatimonas lonarensis]|uniref:DUF4240 domain-containing protein n=1 Tax=Lunatimonas lonarensis TaxID=1232681 RepID=R7ZNV8_9BACT|nr:DUF4240 domain-containing protein [Lunatimonas lonarensis]EON75709.1 hypothetical protein ADIS_3799 [Lunatimonas lonarensis]